MKKYCLILTLLTLLMVSCGKRTDTFAFSGTVIGYCECTMPTASISEKDFGYIVNIDKPDSIGGQYITDGVTYKNAICSTAPRHVLPTAKKSAARCIWMTTTRVPTAPSTTTSAFLKGYATPLTKTDSTFFGIPNSY